MRPRAAGSRRSPAARAIARVPYCQRPTAGFPSGTARCDGRAILRSSLINSGFERVLTSRGEAVAYPTSPYLRNEPQPPPTKSATTKGVVPSGRSQPRLSMPCAITGTRKPNGEYRAAAMKSEAAAKPRAALLPSWYGLSRAARLSAASRPRAARRSRRSCRNDRKASAAKARMKPRA